MLLFNNIHLQFFFIVLILISSINSSTPKLKSAEHRRLSKVCGIQDYSAWLQRQDEFLIWLDLAKLLRLSFDDNPEFQRELRQYRLQYQCLRLVERLPLSIGPG